MNFRNKVIHQGKIPSPSEAREYGQVVLDLIRPTLRETKQKFPKGVQQTIVEHLAANRRLGETSAVMTMASIVGLNREDESWNKRSLEQAIKELRRWDVQA